MTTISLAMIVKNEEATLAHCLESVKSIVDEIIIIDTGSTDRTVEIAGGFGALIHPFKWCDDFSAARNESLKHCTGDWVLILDADEAIDPLDYEKIKNACRAPVAEGYVLTQRNYMYTSLESGQDKGAVPNKSPYNEGRHLPFYGDNYILRLARNFDGLAFTGRIHEAVDNSLLSHGKAIKKLDAVLHHYGKLISGRDEYKAHYYLMLTRMETEKNPEDLTAQFNLLQQALVAEQWEVALEAAKASLKIGTIVKPLVFFGAGTALLMMGRYSEAIEYFDMLLAQMPGHALAMARKALCVEALGDANRGRELLLKAIEVQPDYVPSHGWLAEMELRAGKFDDARKTVLVAIQMAPNEPALYDILLKIELDRGNMQQAAIDALNALQKCPTGGGGLWHRLAATFLAQSNELTTARAILDVGLKVFPDDPDLMRLKGMISS